MNHARVMRRLETTRDLRADRKCVFNGERAGRELFRQRLPLDELEHQQARVTGVLDPVDRRDVGVVQRCEEPRLPLQPRESFRVRGESRGERLERDLAPQPCVPCPIDLAHPARAERSEDLVRAVLRAGRERHRREPFRNHKGDAPRMPRTLR